MRASSLFPLCPLLLCALSLLALSLLLLCPFPRLLGSCISLVALLLLLLPRTLFPLLFLLCSTLPALHNNNMKKKAQEDNIGTNTDVHLPPALLGRNPVHYSR